MFCGSSTDILWRIHLPMQVLPTSDTIVVSSPRRVGNSLVGTETIFDAELIQNVSVGDLIEVSLGQEVVVDATAGEYNGVRYDQAQRKMCFNHLAHVQHGRLTSLT